MFKHYKYIVLHKTIIFWSKKQRNLHVVIQCFCDTTMFLGANLMVCLLVYMSQKDAKAHAKYIYIWILDGILYILLKYSW